MEIREDFVQTGTFTTHYWEVGIGETIILLHGGGAGADAYGNFNKNLVGLAEAGYRAIAYDAIGFGKTDKPNPEKFDYTHNTRVNQLLDFIDGLDLEQVTLIGNSMGGATSIGAAIREPQKVKRLILMGTAGRLNSEDTAKSKSLNTLFEYKITKEKMYNIVRHLTNDEFEVDEEYLNYRLRLIEDPEVMVAYKATMEEIKKGIYFNDEQLKSISHNTLLIHGKNDRMVPIDKSYELFNIMNNAWFYAKSNCGHWAMIEYPEEFNRLCIDFIKNH